MMDAQNRCPAVQRLAIRSSILPAITCIGTLTSGSAHCADQVGLERKGTGFLLCRLTSGLASASPAGAANRYRFAVRLRTPWTSLNCASHVSRPRSLARLYASPTVRTPTFSAAATSPWLIWSLPASMAPWLNSRMRTWRSVRFLRSRSSRSRWRHKNACSSVTYPPSQRAASRAQSLTPTRGLLFGSDCADIRIASSDYPLWGAPVVPLCLSTSLHISNRHSATEQRV